MGALGPHAYVTWRRQRTRFSAAEEAALRAGFREHGTAWAKILAAHASVFKAARTGVDLKDKARNMGLVGKI